MNINVAVHQLKQTVSSILNLSDRILFKKDIELQRGRHISAVYAGRVNGSSSAGTPFPAGWTVAQNSTGNCTVTHNLNRDDHAVLVSLIDDDATTLGTSAITVTSDKTTFTVDIGSSGLNFNHDFYFAVLT